MRYTLMLYSREAEFVNAPPEAMAESLQAFGQYIAALKKAGVFVDTDWLQPTSTATTLSLRGGPGRCKTDPSPRPKSSSAATS